MKKLLLAIVAASIILSAGLASAATTSTTMNVLLNIGAVVQVSTTDLNFGSILPGDPGPIITSTITVTAPSGLPYNISLDAGQNFDGLDRRISDGMGNFVYYIIADPAGMVYWGDSDFANTFPMGASIAGVGTGAPQTLSPMAGLSSSTLMPNGTYTDIVLVTVNY